MCYLDDLETLCREISKTQEGLIGVDGFPCSGKTTLVEKLVGRLGCRVIYLDDFVVAETEFGKMKPSFPPPYFRYAEFTKAVATAAEKPAGLVLVEGVSVFLPSINRFLARKVFVFSDRATEWSALERREKADTLPRWKELFLPSVEPYFRSEPWRQADMVYAGRGIRNKEALRERLGERGMPAI